MKRYFIGERLTMWIVEGPRVSIGRQKVFCLGAALWQEVEKKPDSDKKWTKKKKGFVPPPTQPSSLVSINTSRILELL